MPDQPYAQDDNPNEPYEADPIGDVTVPHPGPHAVQCAECGQPLAVVICGSCLSGKVKPVPHMNETGEP